MCIQSFQPKDGPLFIFRDFQAVLNLLVSQDWTSPLLFFSVIADLCQRPRVQEDYPGAAPCHWQQVFWHWQP